MPYVQNALSFTIETLIGLYLIAVILRFLFQLLRIDFRNPIVQMIVTITNPPIIFLRKFIPGLYGIDLASLLLIVIIGMAKLALLLFVAGYSIKWSGVLVLSLADSLNAVIWVFLIAVLIRIILSWIAPRSYHPAVRILDGLSEPILAPFRRLLPSMGGLDLSPILTLLALRLVQQLVVSPLTDFGRSLL